MKCKKVICVKPKECIVRMIFYCMIGCFLNTHGTLNPVPLISCPKNPPMYIGGLRIFYCYWGWV